jgi:alpha-beta hydrolase superfamily lysophospholipase
MSHSEKSATGNHSAAAPATITSMRPVVLSAPGRGADLQLRVSAPIDGNDLPVVVFSHGFGFSMDAYGPLVDHWAANGFIVIQPTHLDSVSLGLAPDDPRIPRIWHLRIEDLTHILDELESIEASVPGLEGRVNRERIAAAGHSYGATTAGALLGARVLAPAGDPEEDMTDPRVTAGVLLALAGTGGDDLRPLAAQMFPFMNPSFEAMRTPALITAGDHDQSPLSVRGPDWWTDAYRQSPGEKSLLTLFGAEHSQGGVHAYGGIAQTEAESPALLALVQRMTTAYLRRTLYSEDREWSQACAALQDDPDPVGRLESK